MKFEPAVEFPVSINGKPGIAKVHEELDHPVQTIFRVSFDDGFEDEFLIEQDGRIYGSGIAAIPYAKAIYLDIGYLSGLDPNRFYYNYSATIDGMPTKVWVMEDDDENNEIIYKVYYFDFFRFALKRQDNAWVVSHFLIHRSAPDASMVEKMGYLLDALLDEKH